MSGEIEQYEEPGEVQAFDEDRVDLALVQSLFKDYLLSLVGNCDDCHKRCPHCPHKEEFAKHDYTHADENCEYEIAVLYHWFKQYREYYGISPRDIPGLEKLKRMLRIKLKLFRLDLEDTGDHTEEEVVAMDWEGNEITQEVVKKEEELQERLEQRLDKAQERLEKFYSPEEQLSTLSYAEAAARVQREQSQSEVVKEDREPERVDANSKGENQED